MDVGALMVDIAACLCQKAHESDAPDLCYCGILPGQAPIDMSGLDCEPAGQGWVRLTTAYPSERVGAPTTQVGNCNNALGIGLEVGLLRHFPISEESLTDEEILEAGLIQIADMQIIRDAILCCDSLQPEDFILNTYTPLGPIGGLVGGQWTISVGVL